MTSEKHKNIAIKYRVEDLPGALQPSSRLSNILENLELGLPITRVALNFLQNNGLFALLNYATNQISFDELLNFSEVEKAARLVNEKIRVEKDLIEQKQKQEAEKLKMEAMFARLENDRKAKFERKELALKQAEEKKRILGKDTRYIESTRKSQLMQKYGFSNFSELADLNKVLEILLNVDKGQRLSVDEYAWLSGSRDKYHPTFFTTKLKEAYHENEADFHTAEFEKKKDLWSVVNACKHYRKARLRYKAESLFNGIDLDAIKEPKLKSAICTTQGGVKRDLKKWAEAIKLADLAHLLTPRDYRPCTLLGAIGMETGDYVTGHSWYSKATERGYEKKFVDEELQGILKRLDKTKQKEMRDKLYSIDPVRYSRMKITSAKKGVLFR